MEPSEVIPIFNIPGRSFGNITRNFIGNFFRIFREYIMELFHEYSTNIYLPGGIHSPCETFLDNLKSLLN